MIADFIVGDRGASLVAMIHVGVAARVNPDAAERSPRVKVYTGYDHVSAKRHHLDEVMAAGPRVAAGAEKVRMQLPNEVDEHRNPKTRATVNPLLDRYLETLDGGADDTHTL